ncbi:MAG: PorT family protein [Bacteroidales bacterium]|jgi:hypothetical protein|nr:PorT family protein [Bacteroidales bacterium]
MKTKIKFLLIAVIFSCAFGLSANAQGQFGLQFGYNNTKFKTKIGSTTTKSDPLNGFNVGLTYDYDFHKYVGLQTGVLYSLYHKKDELTVFGTTSTNKITYHYATIPVNVKGKYEFGNSGLSVFAFAGPDFIIGIAANSKTKIGNSPESSMNLYDDDYDFNRFDIALGLGAGVQYKSLRLKFGYDIGLLNLADTDGDNKYKRNYFNISLGLLF